MLQIAILCLGIVTMLVPLSNTITGPISGGVANTTNASQVVNGSFSDGEFSGFSNSSLFFDDSGDYCSNSTLDGSGVNENSIKRVPVYIWAFLIFLNASIFLSRYVVAIRHDFILTIFPLGLLSLFILCLFLFRTNGFACIIVLVNNSSLVSPLCAFVDVPVMDLASSVCTAWEQRPGERHWADICGVWSCAGSSPRLAAVCLE